MKVIFELWGMGMIKWSSSLRIMVKSIGNDGKNIIHSPLCWIGCSDLF
jgi:hypothetical protein